METKEKKNNTHVAVEVILSAIILGLGVYIAYSKGLILTKEKITGKGNEQQEEKVKKEEAEEKTKIPTDMEKVNKELNNYLSKYLTYRKDESYFNKNMLSDPSNKLNLINFVLEENGMWNKTNYASSGSGRQDFSYISIDTYKTKYKEIYGNLDDFETEMKNANPAVINVASNIDSTMSSNLVAWNSTFGTSAYKAKIEASKITYDKSSRQYTITGTVHYESQYDGITPENDKHTFELIYANDEEQNYLISLMLL